MAYILKDLIDVQQFQMLQDRLNDIYSFPSAIIDNDGNVLTASAWQDVCTKFHRTNAECLKECIKSDQYIMDHLSEARPAVSYTCPHGLVDNATPIIIEGVHYGNFFTGQFFLEPPDLEFFRAQAKKFGFDESAYLAAVVKVPVWTREQLQNYLFFIKGLIEVISGMGLKNMKELEARKQIREDEERYTTLLRTATDGFWMVDANGYLLEVNEAYCRMSGYSEQELLTMRISDLDVEETTEGVGAHMQEIKAQREDRFETQHRRKDGSVLQVEISVQYTLIKGGRFVAFLRDITERKRGEDQLRESEASLRESQRIARMGSFVFDFVIGTWQSSVVLDELLGIDGTYERSLDGWLGLVHPDDRSVTTEYLANTVTDRDQVFDREHRIIRQDDRAERWLWSRASLERDASGRALRLHGTSLDITDRKRAEEEVRRAQKEALAASKLKSTLLANLSHEFRTPLTGILGCADILADELTDSTLAGFVEGIAVSGKRLSATLSAMMELAQLSSPGYPMRLDDLVLEREVDRVMKDHESIAKKRNLYLRLVNNCGGLLVRADRAMFRMAVSKLVDNALKFTKEGGVNIILRTEGNAGDRMAVCEIRDSGIGIATEDSETIFEEFKQLSEGFGRSHEGSGVGLTIARKMIDLMHGSIRVESRPGKGSSFSILLPISTATAAREAGMVPPAVGARSSKPLILLVEDNVINAMVVAHDLQDICILEHAKDGLIAIEMATRKSYDAILMDINLGSGMSGVEVMTHLRKLPAYAGRPIAAVTGYTTVGEKENFFDQGFTHYLPKPFDKDDIAELVGQMVNV